MIEGLPNNTSIYKALRCDKIKKKKLLKSFEFSHRLKGDWMSVFRSKVLALAG